MSRYQVLLALLAATAAFAQTGQVRIQVQDPTGAALEAAGHLQSLTSGFDRAFEADAQGSATVSDVPYGRYRLEITKTGFAPSSEVFDVDSATIARQVTLSVGATSVRVDVVGTTPLPGVDLLRTEIPANVQTASARDIEQSGALDLSDFLNKRLTAVYLNEVQGNPYQPDLNYRGYTASPLLGTPQGLSVYMDGVRLNQPFGDVVSWDLIPRIAIQETSMMPGSNPMFGLNTLGGALSVRTKDGLGPMRTAVGVSGGTFGRKIADLEHGGSAANGFNWYGAANLFFEDGWRDNSPSNVRQFFGKAGWQGARTTLSATLAYANNSLLGNGLQEQTFLARDYASVYTKPDITNNRSPFFNFRAQHAFSNSLTFSGNVYYRYIETSTLNGDINEEALDQSLYQPGAAERNALAAAGFTGVPTAGENASNTPFPKWRCIGNALIQDEPAEKCNGLINTGGGEQHNAGFQGQVTWLSAPRGHRNQFTIGGAYDHNSVDFIQNTQLGYLNPDRSVTGVPAFGDGERGGDTDGEPYDVRVNLNSSIHTGSFFVTDTLSAGAWNFTASGRYNRTTLDNNDRIRPTGPGTLTATHVFERFNPAVGVTFNPIPLVNTYFGYSEGSRAPTSIELGCADPEQPCKLPNAMAGDPPLDQVRTRTWEAGVRSGSESRFGWSFGYFRSDNRDDILFVASEQTGFGYFKNFDKTRRQGIELGANGRMGRVSAGLGYTYLDATYQSEEEVNGESNSSNEEALEGGPGLEGLIEIEPGNKIPLIPQHMGKVWADVQVSKALTLNLSMLTFSSSYARGNENNGHQADGVYYLGPGKSPGYAVFNLGGRYLIGSRVELFGQVNNLFDRHYYTAAQLGPTGFISTGNFIARPFPAVAGEFPIRHSTFFAPGAPRMAWGGVRIHF